MKSMQPFLKKAQRMRRGFTLVEMLFALILLGIFGVFGGLTLLKIYQDYHWQESNFIQEIQAQNALLQIKHLLENSYLQSLMISSGEEIGASPLSLRGKSLMFYEKAQEYVLVGDYALPCLHGVFEPKSAKWNHFLELEFLDLDSKSNGILNQKCSLYQKPNMPQKALFISSSFVAPKDFYHLKFQGKIVELNAHKILLEIPLAFKDFMQTKKSLGLTPQVYFLNSVSYLHFNDSIVLESQSQLQGIPQNTQQIIQEITDFKIAKTPLGFALEVCVPSAGAIPYCAKTLVVEIGQ